MANSMGFKDDESTAWKDGYRTCYGDVLAEHGLEMNEDGEITSV